MDWVIRLKLQVAMGSIQGVYKRRGLIPQNKAEDHDCKKRPSSGCSTNWLVDFSHSLSFCNLCLPRKSSHFIFIGRVLLYNSYHHLYNMPDI